MIREANMDDLDEILNLYLYLHETNVPEDSQELRDAWDSIINDNNHHLMRKCCLGSRSGSMHEVMER